MSTLKVDNIRHNSATSDAITTHSDGTCTAKVTNPLSNRRLNYNGAMLVNQRGNTNTGSFSYYYGPDRYYSQVMVIIMETGISDNQQMFLMDMDLNIVYRMIVLRHPHMQIVT